MPVQKGPNCVGDEMARFKRGELHSGKGGKVVTNPKQAQAIALSACGQSKYSEALKNISGFSPEALASVEQLLYGETDWAKQFRTGKGPGPEKEENYKTGKKDAIGPTDGKITKGPGDMGKQKVNTESEMLSPVAYPKGPGNPQGGSSKEVFGLRMLG